MGNAPDDSDDIDDYDSIAEYVADAMAAGHTIDGDDLEGRDCQYCEELIPFADWPESVVTWDIRIQEPGEEPSDYYGRHYFCSNECRRQAHQDAEWSASHEAIHEDELEGRV
ncbi:hypothetical protein [Haloarcula amylovorans]|uniref:hypothetical protein n=1 Tax=Haloarcula amylovorans TaxID=2562280 RepID=UPI001075E622|nr:hypothetical protein [Halomicroarcula amylolytica]